jgi:uncharacterized protein YmfQ (DUF2313 family)
MAQSSAAYLLMLQALLPRGRAWPRDPDAVLTQVLGGMADGLAQVDADLDRLMLEADPRTADVTLPDWQRNFGLPYPGVGPFTSNADAQAAIVAQMNFKGGKSRAWFEQLATTLGFDSYITQLRPFRASLSGAGSSTDTDPARYAWTFTVFTADPTSQAALTLQYLVQQYTPAETFVTLTFVDPDASVFEVDFLTTGP